MCKFKEVKRVDNMKIRNLCIKDNLYTRGDNKAYENLLFNLCNGDKSIEDIEQIAQDILEHSDWESKIKAYGCDYDELKAIVMSNILSECCNIFVEVVR